MTQNDFDKIWYSTYGGRWDEDSGVRLYDSYDIAFFDGCIYNAQHNSWRSTHAKSFGAAVSAYSLQFLTASRNDVAIGSSFLNGLKQYIAIVVGESTNEMREALTIGCVIINRLKWECSSILDNDFVSKIGGTEQYDAIGERIYNTIMGWDWSVIFSSDNIYASRISGAVTALFSNFDYSYGAYFWNATYQGFQTDECLHSIGPNWRAYYKGTFTITQAVGGTTFFKYTDIKRHWP